MRLIDADGLICSLGDFYKGKKTVGQIIDEQPTVNQWVPVSVKLPEDEEDKLVYLKNGIDYEFHVFYYRLDCKEWDSSTYGFIPENMIVIAWMPLPEPYRED